MRKLSGTGFLAVGVLLAFTSTAHAQRSLFEFHNTFWINLHHYLHAQARVNDPLREALPGGASTAEGELWGRAVSEYRDAFGKESLLFNERLLELKSQLAAAGNAATLPPTVRILRTALETAAPIYRTHWWSSHESANRRFMAQLQPLLVAHGPRVAERLAASFDQRWPATPIRVDLVHDAGPPGNAYTISEPTEITVGVSDPRHTGLASLEIMFHEASHRWDAILMREVDEAAVRLKVRSPRNLWHGLLFFNAGTITQEALAEAGIQDYQTYMVKEGMFERAYRGWQPAIEKWWRTFLSGTITRAHAIENIVKEITK